MWRNCWGQYWLRYVVVAPRCYYILSLGKCKLGRMELCKLEWNFKFLQKALWIYLRRISFHLWKFSLYSLCIQEHFNVKILCFLSTLLKPPSVKLLHNVSCYIFAHLFPPIGRFPAFVLVPEEQDLELMLVMLSKLFWKQRVIWKLLPFLPAIIASCAKVLILLKTFFTVSQKLLLSWSFLLYEICTPDTLIHSLLTSKDFIPQSGTLTLSRTPIPAIPHLMKLGKRNRKANSSLLKQLWWNWCLLKRMWYCPHMWYRSIHDQKFSNHVYFYLF